MTIMTTRMMIMVTVVTIALTLTASSWMVMMIVIMIMMIMPALPESYPHTRYTLHTPHAIKRLDTRHTWCTLGVSDIRKVCPLWVIRECAHYETN